MLGRSTYILPDFKGATVYLSGAITADACYRSKFDGWEIAVCASGAKRCLKPTIFPEGWAYEEYMEHCMIMVRRACTVLMLPDWTESPGAIAERAYANSLKRTVLYAKSFKHHHP